MDGDRRELYEFGPYRLEPAERKPLRGNEVVVLTPKAFDTLLLLVGNSGHLLEKDELLSMPWRDSSVEECVIAACRRFTRSNFVLIEVLVSNSDRSILSFGFRKTNAVFDPF